MKLLLLRKKDAALVVRERKKTVSTNVEAGDENNQTIALVYACMASESIAQMLNEFRNANKPYEVASEDNEQAQPSPSNCRCSSCDSE